MPVLASEVGPVYDLLLATRDGTTLPCKNAKGDLVNLSQIALNFSVNKQHEQEEATELQHKKTVTQLASPNISDRELEQWPQVSQGDWSGGMYQRLFGQDNDTTRYWSGEGILWPLTDWAPQKLVTIGGLNLGLSNSNQTRPLIAGAGRYWHALFKDTTANVIRLQTNDNSNVSVIADWTVSAGGIAANPRDIFFFQNSVWGVFDNGRVVVQNALFTTLAGSAADYHNSAWGQIGNQSYVAFATNTPANRVQLFNVTSTTFTPASNAVTNLTSDYNSQVIDMCFMGDNLYMSITVASPSGNYCMIAAYNVPNQTYTVVATFSNYIYAYIIPVGGVLFILATAQYPYNNNISKAEMYLLQGNNLQDIGPLQVQVGTQKYNSFRCFSRLVTVGSYAIWAVYVNDGTNNWFVPLAYDVLRGRIFKAAQDQILGSETATPATNLSGIRPALVSAPYVGYGTPTANLLGDWLLIRPTGATSTFNAPGVYRYLCAPQNDSNGNYVASRSGVTVLSGIIDGTSGDEPKLFRAVQTKFTALPNDASCSVTLDAWLDQDPSSLSTSPQFTATITGGVATVGATTLNLPINTIAIKLVYRLTITGGTATVGLSGSATLIAAPIPASVAVQIATGWVWNVYVDLAPGVTPNGHGNETTWSRQQVPGQPTVDNVAAYNFIRQTWRMRGGRCTATWGNGDTWPALIQSESFRSPKPFGPSMRADMPSQYQSLGLLSVREDIA